jgi:hypothetical protein
MLLNSGHKRPKDRGLYIEYRGINTGVKVCTVPLADIKDPISGYGSSIYMPQPHHIHLLFGLLGNESYIFQPVPPQLIVTGSVQIIYQTASLYTVRIWLPQTWTGYLTRASLKRPSVGQRETCMQTAACGGATTT